MGQIWIPAFRNAHGLVLWLLASINGGLRTDTMPTSPSLPELQHPHSQRAHMQTMMFHQALASRLGLNATDHKCLMLLLDGPRTAGELAEAAGLTTGTLTAVIDRLEKR